MRLGWLVCPLVNFCDCVPYSGKSWKWKYWKHVAEGGRALQKFIWKTVWNFLRISELSAELLNYVSQVHSVYHIYIYINLALNIDIDINIGFAYFFLLGRTSYHALLQSAMCCAVRLCWVVLDCVRLCWIVWDWGGRWDGLGEHRLFVTTWLIDVGRG